MSIEVAATVLFGLAVVHTFLVKHVLRWAQRLPPGTSLRAMILALSQVELVFGLWASVFLLIYWAEKGAGPTVAYVRTLSFAEPLFIFVTMMICTTRPILKAALLAIETLTRLVPARVPRPAAFYLIALTLGPWFGSLITEPAAMTVTALILRDRFFNNGASLRLRYATIGLLFVNVSIGGTLTSFAAPPVLMVARLWDWNSLYMFEHFGWKAMVASALSTSLTIAVFVVEFKRLPAPAHSEMRLRGFDWREPALVAFFLAGLVVLGPPQRWWLEPLMAQLHAGALYLGAIALTAVTDNAALTYLGSQVPELTEAARYALVSGAVVGGGLTVIANAPNPAGYGLLRDSFGPEGIQPWRLFLGALGPTMIAALCLWLI